MRRLLLIILLFESGFAFSESNENYHSKNNAGSNFNKYLKLSAACCGGY
jgi:hypothetical protein